jgi:rsbT co-antagonist protein RsbR
MRALRLSLFQIASPDEDIRRRGRNLLILCLGLSIVALLFIVIALVQPGNRLNIWAPIIPTLCYAFVIALARRGHVTAGGFTLVLILLAATMGTSAASGQISVTPFYFIIPMLVACLTLRPWQIAAVWATCLLGLTGLAMTLAAGTLVPAMQQQIIVGGYVLTSLTALMGILNASTAQNALDSLRKARQTAESATAALEGANATLEQSVQHRTEQLQSALAEVEQRAATQLRMHEELESQREAIRELSVPVLPINRDTLVMPLVGALDTTRLLQLQEQALHAIEHSNARRLLLDITGVAVVDSQVAQGLVRVVEAARLLGTEVNLVGIRPEVAQAVVSLGMSLHGMRSYRDIFSALDALAKS